MNHREAEDSLKDILKTIDGLIGAEDSISDPQTVLDMLLEASRVLPHVKDHLYVLDGLSPEWFKMFISNALYAMSVYISSNSLEEDEQKNTDQTS